MDNEKVQKNLQDNKDNLVKKDRDYLWHALIQYKEAEEYIPKILNTSY